LGVAFAAGFFAVAFFAAGDLDLVAAFLVAGDLDLVDSFLVAGDLDLVFLGEAFLVVSDLSVFLAGDLVLLEGAFLGEVFSFSAVCLLAALFLAGDLPLGDFDLAGEDSFVVLEGDLAFLAGDLVVFLAGDLDALEGDCAAFDGEDLVAVRPLVGVELPLAGDEDLGARGMFEVNASVFEIRGRPVE